MGIPRPIVGKVKLQFDQSNINGDKFPLMQRDAGTLNGGKNGFPLSRSIDRRRWRENFKEKEVSVALQGLIVPLLTPLDRKDQIDLEALEKLIRHVVTGGVHGVFILGTTGEGFLLPMETRRALIRQARAKVPEHISLWAGVGNCSVQNSLNLIYEAFNQGVDAIVLPPPPFFLGGEKELWDYIKIFIRKSPVPIVLYSMAGRGDLQWPISIVRRAMQEQKILGIKDSSGNWEYFLQLLNLKKQRRDWGVWMGPDSLTAEAIRQGANGGVNGGANLVPQWYQELYKALRQGRDGKARQWERKIQQLDASFSGIVPHQALSVIRGIKGMAALLGLCSDRMVSPYGLPSAKVRQEIRRRALEVGLPIPSLQEDKEG